MGTTMMCSTQDGVSRVKHSSVHARGSCNSIALTQISIQTISYGPQKNKAVLFIIPLEHGANIFAGSYSSLSSVPAGKFRVSIGRRNLDDPGIHRDRRASSAVRSQGVTPGAFPDTGLRGYP